MTEEGETTLGSKMFQRHRAGFTTQRILQARRRQSDSGSPVNDLGTINENNTATSSPSPRTTPTPEVQNEEAPTGFFRRAFRSRQLRGSFRERELEDLDAKANQYSKQVKEKDLTERISQSTPATPEVMQEPHRKFELFRRSSVPADLEEYEEPNIMDQWRPGSGQGHADDFRESYVSQIERQRTAASISGLQSIKMRHAMMAQKFQRMLSTESEDHEDSEVVEEQGQESDIMQQMSDNPRLSAIYQRLQNLGFNRPQPSSPAPLFEHIDTLDCEKPKSRTAFDRSSFLRDSQRSSQAPSVSHSTEVTTSFDNGPTETAETAEQVESHTLPRTSYLNTKHSIGSANSDSSTSSYSVASLKRQSFKSGAKKSLLDEDEFLTSPSLEYTSPSYEPDIVDEGFQRIEPSRDFVSSMQALREQISNLHLSNGAKERSQVYEYNNNIPSDAQRYGVVDGTDTESQDADITVSDSNQTVLNSTFTLEDSPGKEGSPERQVLGAEKTVKSEKQTPKKGKVAPKVGLRSERIAAKTDRQPVRSDRQQPVKSDRQQPIIMNERRGVKNDTSTKKDKPAVKSEKPVIKSKPVIKKDKPAVKNDKQPKAKSAVRASSATFSSVGLSVARTTASVANKSKTKELEFDKKEKVVKAKTPERNTKGPGTLKNTTSLQKEVLSPPRVRKFTDNLAHGGSGVLDVRVTSTDTISSGRNSLESQTDSNNTDEVFIDDKNFVTNLDREISLSVDSIEGAEKTVELSDIKRLAAARRSVRSTSSDFSASYGGRSSSTPGKLRKQISDVSGRVKSFVKKQQHSKGAHREDPDGEEVNSGGYSDGEIKRRSTSDLSMSSSANTGMSRRSSLWSDAQPITDNNMRSKLRSAASARVNAKDQRILELMMKKREDAKRQQQLRETAQMAWEEEKVRAQKARSDSSRRSSLAEPRSKSQPRMKDRHKTLSTDSSSHRTPRKTDLDDAKSCDTTSPSVSRVMLERERKLLEKKRANLERKKSQEQRLAEQEREKALLNSQIKAKQAQDLKRAQQLKESKEKEEAKQRKLKSYYVKRKQEEKLTQIRKQSEEEQEQLAAALNQKMAIAETNLHVRQERRLADAKQAMTDLEQRLELSRQNQKRMQDEMSAWHSELQNYRKMMDEKAKEQTRRQLEEKRRKAAEDLKHKKLLQQENMQRLLEQEDEWKNDVEATIAMKDARCKMIQIEKDELLEESRSLAQASQLLREELRMAYSIDHMDKMNRRAELEARIQKPL